MTDGGVPHDDMLKFPWRSRLDLPPVGDEALDALLARDLAPGDTAATLRPVAEVLAALRSAPAHGELTGLDQALAEFRQPGGAPPELHQPRLNPRPRKAALRRTVIAVKLAAAAAVVVLAGGIAAAYDDALPPALQKLAHISIAAPAARSHPSHDGHPVHPSGGATSARPHRTHHADVPVGPSAAGPAAYGLCRAYFNAEAHGSPSQQAVPSQNLVTAAGGADNVTAYCANVPHPGASPSGQSASHGNGNGNGNGNENGGQGNSGNGNGSDNGNGNGNGKQKGKAAS